MSKSTTATAFDWELTLTKEAETEAKTLVEQGWAPEVARQGAIDNVADDAPFRVMLPENTPRGQITAVLDDRLPAPGELSTDADW